MNALEQGFWAVKYSGGGESGGVDGCGGVEFWVELTDHEKIGEFSKSSVLSCPRFVVRPGAPG